MYTLFDMIEREREIEEEMGGCHPWDGMQ